MSFTYSLGLSLSCRLVPILARCVSSKSQRWSFDIQLKQIHPQNEYSWCLDSDFDKGVRRPMTVFRCGKTFSQKAATNHQQVHLHTHTHFNPHSHHSHYQ